MGDSFEKKLTPTNVIYGGDSDEESVFFDSDPDGGGIDIVKNTERSSTAIFNTPTRILVELGDVLRDEKAIFDDCRLTYLRSLREVENTGTHVREAYIQTRNNLYIKAVQVASSRLDIDTNFTAYLKEAFFAEEAQAVEDCGGNEEDVREVMREADVVANEVPVSSQTLVEKMITNSPVSGFEGLSEQLMEEYLSAREDYFTTYATYYRTHKSGLKQSQLKERRQRYLASLRLVAHEIRTSDISSDGQEKELLVALFLDESQQLLELRELAEKERSKAKKENIRTSLLGRSWRLVLVSLAAVAVQTVGFSPHQPKSVTAYETSIENDTEPIIATEASDGQNIETVSRIEPILASEKGPVQMFHDLLLQLKNVDTAAHDRLVRADENALVAAERIAQETGFWELSPEFNRSAIVHEDDYLTLNEKGELMYVRGGDAHVLTIYAVPIKQDWLTYQ